LLSVLSGGERSRLILCKLLLSPANCLLLDEPTNHLDIRSKDILMDSLREYGGTLVFVSHDRYFLDGLATKVLEIGNQTATPYLGNYEDYLFRKAELERGQSVQPENSTSVAHRSGGNEADARSGLRKKKVNPYKIRQIKNQIETLEGQIQSHETRIAVLNRLLASEDLYRDYPLFRTTLEEHDQLQRELDEFINQWESLQSKLAKLQTLV
jgi:ATP-binding cassette subfamily F protein 3